MHAELIIGTAGHIDHGKTTLIQALCGKNLDSTPEEKARGITINLGFAHTLLPTGIIASFIDVPGHERLIRTMISGATSMDAVLLCVSAVDGVMPQTKEHLAILKLLGVSTGVVAMTMSDLVDEEMRELALLDIEELIEETFLEGAPIIQTAITPNASEGVSELLEAFGKLEPKQKDHKQPFTMSIDRCFTQKGFGNIVTGTARGLPIQEGASIMVMPDQKEGRIRKIQHHGKEQRQTQGGTRTALNISGISKEWLSRGKVLCAPQSIPPTSILDAQYHHLSQAPTIKDGSRVRLLYSSVEIFARVVILSPSKALEEGTYFLQLRCSEPIIILPQERFILRQESPLCTLGGGVVIDPWAPKLRVKHHEEACAQLHAILDGNRSMLLQRRSTKGMPTACTKIFGLSGQHLDKVVWDQHVHVKTLRSICSSVGYWHNQNPLSVGCPFKELLHLYPLPITPKGYQTLLNSGIKQNLLKEPQKGVFALPNFTIALTPHQEKQKEIMLKAIYHKGLEGAALQDYINHELLGYLLANQSIVRIQNHVLSQKRISQLRVSLDQFFQKHAFLTPTDFKELTSLSRKYAIPILEWLDQQGYTLRMGDKRKKR